MKTETFKGLHGTATLYLGDCLDILPTLTGIDAVITDPPYGVMLGEVKNGQALEKNQQPYCFSDTEENVRDSVIPAIEMCIAMSKRVVVTPGNRCMWLYPRPDDIGCWFVPASTSRSKWGFALMNPILYYGKSPMSGKGDTANSISLQVSRDKHIDHPCPKPYRVVGWLVLKGSLRGETVLDPFCGSGTTGIACLRTGRNFIGIEKDSNHFATACERFAREIDGQLL